MVAADRAIFRETAIAAYRRGTDKDQLPRLTRWPTIALCWLLLTGLAIATVLAWSTRVPAYVAASGVVLARAAKPGPTADQTAGSGAAAMLFLPPGQLSQIRVGQSVHGQIGSSGTHVAGIVRRIEPGVIGPVAARNRYELSGSWNALTQPSCVVIVGIGRALPPTVYGGSRWTAKIQVGSQRLLSFVPGIG